METEQYISKEDTDNSKERGIFRYSKKPESPKRMNEEHKNISGRKKGNIDKE